MPASRGVRILLLVALAGLAAAVLREWRRPVPPEETPVAGRLPVRSDETSRTEGGFSWTRTREGRVVFRLEADSLVGVEGGAHFVRGVRRLSLYTEDGREVRLGARAARVLQQSGRGTGKEAWELALEGDVVVRDPGGTVLEADRLEWNADTETLFSPGPATVRGEDLLAHVAGLEYRPEARLVVGHGPVDLTVGAGRPVRVDADRFVYRLATGTVVLETPFRARRPRGAFHAAGGILERRSTGGWDLAARGPVLLAPHVARVAWTFAAAALSARQEPAADVPPVEAGGPGVLVVPGAAPGTGGTLAAFRWTFSGDRERVLRATGSLEGRWKDRKEGEWTLRADRVLAREEPGGRRVVEVTGNLRISGPGDVQAAGDRVSWDSRHPAELRLSAAPRARVARGPDVIEAPRFLLDRHRQILEALDAPITDVRAGGKDETGLFRGGTPVRVRSRRVTVPLRGGPLVFAGPLMAWQEDRDLRASTMSWDPDGRRLEAEGDVVVHVVRPGKEGRPPAAGWLRGDHLVYAAETREAVVTGHAEFQQPGGVTIRASTIRVVLDREGTVERLLARDGVRLQDREARGTADLLEWTGGPGGTIVFRAGEHLPEIEARAEGTKRRITAPVIRYDLADGSIHVSGEGGRTRLRAPGTEERKGDD